MPQIEDGRAIEAREGLLLYDTLSEASVGYDVDAVVFASIMLLTDVIFDTAEKDRDDEMRNIIHTFNQFLVARRKHEGMMRQ